MSVRRTTRALPGSKYAYVCKLLLFHQMHHAILRTPGAQGPTSTAVSATFDDLSLYIPAT